MFEVNGRRYARPKAPTVVVCVDGCEPDYIALAVAAGAMPWMSQVLRRGTALLADCVIPSFTNPNNLSIVTGVAPAVHGITGNYFYDPATGREVMMNDPQWLRVPTLLSRAAQAGLSVAVITAKDKLRRLLGHELKGICFSSEKADGVTLEENGITGIVERIARRVPEVYSAELSEFVFAAALDILARERPDILYLSTTDYVQHKHAPGTPEANSFYAMLDHYLGRLDQAGAIIAVTADHGMNSKVRLDGTPNVIYLQELVDETLGPGVARVILPITDPYVVHHGALGSFATIYVEGGVGSPACERLVERLQRERGLERVCTREIAAGEFELLGERIGDLTVVSERSVVLGTRASEHDLSALEAPLRSHGGLSEQRVPLILNRRCREGPTRPRNFDAYHYALNLVVD